MRGEMARRGRGGYDGTAEWDRSEYGYGYGSAPLVSEKHEEEKVRDRSRKSSHLEQTSAYLL